MPTPELRAYAGRYDSRETGSPAEVMAADGGVAVRFGRGSLSRLELARVSRDVFRLGSMVARFERNEAGDVVAFNYSDPLLRSLCFVRPPSLAAAIPVRREP
jgi:hypothetical protein